MREQKTEAQGARPLIPLSRWNERHMYPSERQLRWLVFRRENGFDRCVVRIGKRVLIDEQKFFEWVDSQQLGVAHV